MKLYNHGEGPVVETMDRFTALFQTSGSVTAAYLVPACSAHWRMNPFCLPQLRFVEVSGTAARVFKAAGLAAACK